MRSPLTLVATIPKRRAPTSRWARTGRRLRRHLRRHLGQHQPQGNTTETSYLTPSVEAITEFAVDTNGFKAEYGQAGGGVISFASKSGTNEVHGSAYDFIRNDYVDSRGFFAPTKGIYRQTDFGGSLGAPLWIPKVYTGRNRTFFFVAYEASPTPTATAAVSCTFPRPKITKVISTIL